MNITAMYLLLIFLTVSIVVNLLLIVVVHSLLNNQPQPDMFIAPPAERPKQEAFDGL